VTTVAHYNLLEKLGEGGLGEVYRARDTKVGRTVAVKLTPEGFAGGPRQHRLVKDAQAAAALSHPHIATLFDVGEHQGRLYLAYEFVQGTPLRQQMSSAPMNARHALDLATQAADALAHAHQRGVLHKDIRPDTILETDKGSAKVLDFGMSIWTRGGQTRALAAASPGSVPDEAARVAAYMSPEQALGGAVDARTDVFSLAVVTYEMLTGRNPFAGPDVGTILLNVSQVVPPPPTSLVPDLPKMVDVVLARALTKSLDRRTESASRLAAELRRCSGLLEPAAGEPPPRSAPRRQSAPDLLPLEEEKRGGALWWLIAIAGAGAAIWYLLA
jgi:serine/threonine-protein kinase